VCILQDRSRLRLIMKDGEVIKNSLWVEGKPRVRKHVAELSQG
jgi:hypothetical protein